MKKIVLRVRFVSGGVLRLLIVMLVPKVVPARTEPEYPDVADIAAPAPAVVGNANGERERRAVATRARDQGARSSMPLDCRDSPGALHRGHLSCGR
jgi:hypothetical protein